MSEIPDSAPIFEEPSKLRYGKFCLHASYTVNPQQRTLTCNECGGFLDAFDIVQRRASLQWQADDLDKQIREKRGKIIALQGEETRIKARTRNARKKDADEAVKAAVERKDEAHKRALFHIWSARNELETALKQLGFKEKS